MFFVPTCHYCKRNTHCFTRMMLLISSDFANNPNCRQLIRTEQQKTHSSSSSSSTSSIPTQRVKAKRNSLKVTIPFLSQSISSATTKWKTTVIILDYKLQLFQPTRVGKKELASKSFFKGPRDNAVSVLWKRCLSHDSVVITNPSNTLITYWHLNFLQCLSRISDGTSTWQPEGDILNISYLCYVLWVIWLIKAVI